MTLVFHMSAQLVVLWMLLVAIVAGNATVILALLLTKTRKSRMNFFIMHLAIADLWVGLISVLPDLIQRITISWLAGSIACKLMKYLQFPWVVDVTVIPPERFQYQQYK
ncbi:unnamed protein product [Leptidea sinapis]|uniref:G-protein coupled receptors family 1 profile domain-containing protein n=1 Tax=Leptidea sinapis TaxID=189913 RepID=A0A5E4QNI1_9NEOP|nr:unnamed protein product [Leptidea sinapis]